MAVHIEGELKGKPGYEGYLRKDVPTLAEMLSQAGYSTAMVGKWHLGLEEDQSPAARGFQKSFAMLEGTQNHFGANQDERWDAVGEASTFREGRALAKYPTGVYDADYYADRLIGFLNEAGPDKPFFAYMALTQPHWPLQAPAQTIAKYKGRYDAGPEVLRSARLERQKALGLVRADVRAHPVMGAKAWDSLSPEQRAIEARRMEIYAAMVDEMDQSVGRVLEALRKRGQLDNTIVVFMSDNGPHARPEERPNVRPHRAPSPQDFAALKIDNSLENLGAATSYTAYGPVWAQAGSAPSRLFKGLTTQGGIRTTALVAGPGVVGGRTSPAFLHVTDIAPTVLDLAGAEGQAVLKTRKGPPFEGRSWAKLLRAEATDVRGPDEVMGWELFFGRAVRQGDWKATYVVMPGAGGVTAARWELFNLRDDPGETQDLAQREPQRLQALVKSWEAYAHRNGVVLPSAQTTARP
jgi:arylsulfatase A-like enzyme